MLTKEEIREIAVRRGKELRDEAELVTSGGIASWWNSDFGSQVADVIDSQVQYAVEETVDKMLHKFKVESRPYDPLTDEEGRCLFVLDYSGTAKIIAAKGQDGVLVVKGTAEPVIYAGEYTLEGHSPSNVGPQVCRILIEKENMPKLAGEGGKLGVYMFLSHQMSMAAQQLFNEVTGYGEQATEELQDVFPNEEKPPAERAQNAQTAAPAGGPGKPGTALGEPEGLAGIRERIDAAKHSGPDANSHYDPACGPHCNAGG